ncbi:uncharacterized protein [Primulina eburnea]|uniref:uncharacterized protein n=1 Tax=Primulina eburnea TaxID=1245227 RepID=UPI003C6C84DD
MIDQEGDNLPKPKTDWTADEVQNLNYNSKALNAIFTSVDMNMFSLVTNCTPAISAWDTLQRHCEGSESVRRTRLRMLTSKFEMMRMEESKNILDYDRRLREIANDVFSIVDSISNERLVSKVLRSLPERFNIKIYTIDEAKDTSQMALEDLISSLRTFEMNLDMQKKDKGKKIAFQASNDSYNELLQISKEIRDKINDAQPSKFPSLPAPERSQKDPAKQQFQPRNEGKGQYNSKSYDSVQCRECKGFGHYANECANTLRKNKGYHVNPLGVTTPGRNICKNSVCFKSTTFGNLSGDDESEADDEETTVESVQKFYEELFENWTKRNKLNLSLMKENVDLKAVVAKLEVILSKKELELGKTKEELQKATEILSKFNSSTSKLDFILLMERDDKKDLGFKDSVFEIVESSKWKLTPHDRYKVIGQCYQIGEELSCKQAQITELDLWHRKLGHVNFKTLKNLSKYEAVRGMPNLSSGIPYVCGECKKRKQTRVSHLVLETSGTTRCLELLRMDLMGPMEVESFGGKKYSFVYVDDFSRFSWVNFIREKSDTFSVFKQLVTRITNFHGLKVRRIRTDHGKEFENSSFSSFCDRKGISHQFSAPKTPQQNGIVERKNRTLQEMARVMLTSKNISKRFWAEALNTACHITNKVYLRSGSTMTSYEIIMGKKPNLKYFHIFGCVCYTLNDRDQLAKFDSKSDKYIKRKTAEDDVDDLLENPSILENEGVVPYVATSSTTRDPEVTKAEDGSNSEDDTVIFLCFVTQTEPKNVDEALKDEFWINAIHDELEEFVRNDVWDLVPPPDHGNIIGTK